MELQTDTSLRHLEAFVEQYDGADVRTIHRAAVLVRSSMRALEFAGEELRITRGCIGDAFNNMQQRGMKSHPFTIDLVTAERIMSNAVGDIIEALTELKKISK